MSRWLRYGGLEGAQGTGGEPPGGRKRDTDNLGGRAVLPPPVVLFGDRSPYEMHRLLEAGPPQMYGLEPGVWLLSLQANYIWPNNIPVAGTYGSVTARISWGSGPLRQYIDVDVWNTRIQLPAERVTVDVFWERLGLAPSFGPIQTFPVEVRATLERASAFAPALAPLKSFWVLETQVDTNLLVDIPPFASAYNFVPMSPTPVGTSPLVQMAAISGATDSVLPAVIESMARMNQWRALPSASKQILLTGAAYPFQWPGRLQFQINA